MIKQSEYTGLDWVVGEISALLSKARRDIERYNFSKTDLEILNDCQEKIRIVDNTLKILKQSRAQLLTREILQFIGKFEKNLD